MTNSDQQTDDEPRHFDPDEETVTDAWEGVFLSCSWGYGQTNVNFAQIVEVSDSGKTVLAKMTAAERVDVEKGSERLRPTADTYGEPFRLHVRVRRERVSFRGSYPYIDGDPDQGSRLDTFLPWSNDADKTIHQTPHTHRH